MTLKWLWRGRPSSNPRPKFARPLEPLGHSALTACGLLENDVPGGLIDYTAVVAEAAVPENYTRIFPTLNERYANETAAFPVFEAKPSAAPIPLEGHLSHVILQLTPAKSVLFHAAHIFAHAQQIPHP
ncbi:hypothetical protein CC1G_15595 [Coprinopsis cinerea okayama7|uniref:Uncharacterized protein n=1 Tax=Coprinopsis cinerea (strain Okayama-7 / 130 / ATCC MYA-4618 / FGSC 9003) TaxID=240176 RepID=D6RNC5_COPC7|nr:hypothetical protein CC1G_15595 [Coprinopsis cinerea okayama7\|eukprot:XP_002911053.1 hypothetical protein CC1G_15595 [Coprinopsis cinerea okayama7\